MTRIGAARLASLGSRCLSKDYTHRVTTKWPWRRHPLTLGRTPTTRSLHRSTSPQIWRRQFATKVNAPKPTPKHLPIASIALAGAGIFTLSYLIWTDGIPFTKVLAAAAEDKPLSQPENVPTSEEAVGKKRLLPKYTTDDVAKHKTKASRIWVTYLDGVYDITDFVDIHPGGARILQAAGGPVDKFWALYKQHLTPDVLGLLEDMRIGSLSDYQPTVESLVVDEYVDEPTDRLSILPVYSEKPFNAGTVEKLIPDSWITPTPLTYVRHHHPVPRIDEDSYRLKLGWGIELSLNDLKTKFPAHEIVATLICAGNRRDEFNEIEPVQGLRWKSDAVSTSKWKGVFLKDLQPLIQDERSKCHHVWFIGRDEPYDASIPVNKAFSPTGDVLIAFEMNDMPIPREHGGPVRVIVPGFVAARSVKWLERIQCGEQESPSPWQQGGAYKSFGPSFKTLTNVDFSQFPSIQEVPVQSAICRYELVDNGRAVLMKGWAWSGGGRRIIRVETSVDGGKTWMDAELGMGKNQPTGQAWAWTFWSHRMDLPGTIYEAELAVRAVDESLNVQPETAHATWNLRGVMNNAYHRIKVAKEKGEHGPTAN